MTKTRAPGSVHLVRPGDTLSGIAAESGTTVARLAKLNGISPSDPLAVGPHGHHLDAVGGVARGVQDGLQQGARAGDEDDETKGGAHPASLGRVGERPSSCSGERHQVV